MKSLRNWIRISKVPTVLILVIFCLMLADTAEAKKRGGRKPRGRGARQKNGALRLARNNNDIGNVFESPVAGDFFANTGAFSPVVINPFASGDARFANGFARDRFGRIVPLNSGFVRNGFLVNPVAGNDTILFDNRGFAQPVTNTGRQLDSNTAQEIQLLNEMKNRR